MSVKMFIAKHYDDILTGITIAGVCSTVACTAKATRNIDEMWDTNYEQWCQGEKCNSKDIRMMAQYNVEKAKTCWKEYLRIGIPVGVTVASVLFMHRNNKKTAAVLTASMAACQQAYDELEKNTKTALGPKKFDELRSKMLGERADQSADIRKEYMANAPETADGSSTTLIYDACSDRYFYGDLEVIRRKAIEMNDELVRSDVNWYSYTDFMEAIGFSGTTLGDCLGWTYNPNDESNSLINTNFTTDLKDDIPYVIMDLKPMPLPKYYIG